MFIVWIAISNRQYKTPAEERVSYSRQIGSEKTFCELISLAIVTNSYVFKSNNALLFSLEQQTQKSPEMPSNS